MLFGNIFAFVFHVYRFHNNQNVSDRIHADILHLQSMIWFWGLSASRQGWI